jgi:hypothetical protein
MRRAAGATPTQTDTRTILTTSADANDASVSMSEMRRAAGDALRRSSFQGLCHDRVHRLYLHRRTHVKLNNTVNSEINCAVERRLDGDSCGAMVSSASEL